VNPRNRFFILLGVIFLIALGYYYFSTPSNKDLVLIGTVDSNQVIVSPQTQGRLQKLLVDEGTPVKIGDLIAVIDPAELQAQAAAAAATINSLRSKVSEMRYTEQSTKGSTSSDVTNAQAKLRSMKSQLDQAQATLRRTESDSRRTIELAKRYQLRRPKRHFGRLYSFYRKRATHSHDSTDSFRLIDDFLLFSIRGNTGINFVHFRAPSIPIAPYPVA